MIRYHERKLSILQRIITHRTTAATTCSLSSGIEQGLTHYAHFNCRYAAHTIATKRTLYLRYLLTNLRPLGIQMLARRHSSADVKRSDLAFCDTNKPLCKFVVRTGSNVFWPGGTDSRPLGGGYCGLYAQESIFWQLSHKGETWEKKVPHKSYSL